MTADTHNPDFKMIFHDYKGVEGLPCWRKYSSTKKWIPIKVKRDHHCCECRKPCIKKGSVAFKPVPPVGFRVCPACALQLLESGKAAIVENEHGQRPTSD